MIQSMFKKVKILDKVKDKDIRVSPLTNFNHAKSTHFAQISREEAFEVCKHFPIFFAKDEQSGALALIALMGVKEGQNLFVDEAGQWDANRYAPMLVRCYPFFIVKAEDRFPIILDEEYEGLNKEDGAILFDDQGELNEYGKKILEFVEKTYFTIESTNPILEMINELGLLKEVGANVEKDGEKYNIRGIWGIDTEKVDALSDEDLLKAARSGALALIHTHLLSLNNIQNLVAKL